MFIFYYSKFFVFLFQALHCNLKENCVLTLKMILKVSKNLSIFSVYIATENAME